MRRFLLIICVVTACVSAELSFMRHTGSAQLTRTTEPWATYVTPPSITLPKNVVACHVRGYRVETSFGEAMRARLGDCGHDG